MEMGRGKRERENLRSCAPSSCPPLARPTAIPQHIFWAQGGVAAGVGWKQRNTPIEGRTEKGKREGNGASLPDMSTDGESSKKELLPFLRGGNIIVARDLRWRRRRRKRSTRGKRTLLLLVSSAIAAALGRVEEGRKEAPPRLSERKGDPSNAEEEKGTNGRRGRRGKSAAWGPSRWAFTPVLCLVC